MKQILIGYPLNKYKEFENILQQLSTEYSLTIKDYDLKWLNDNISEFDILIPSLKVIVDDNIIDKAEKLSLVFTPTTGSDHLRFMQKNKNIKVLSLNDFKDEINSINSTAELSFSLLLSVARKAYLANNQVINECLWDRNNFLGKELNNKTMGIVGMGRIGRKLALYGQAFGMEIVYWDKVESSNFRLISELNQLLSISDFIVISISLNDSTYYLINLENIEHIKKDSILINTSRGKVIEEESLCYALDNGILSGVGVDVIEYELEDFKISPLYKYAKNNPQKNIVITPHIGGATIEAWEKVFTLVFNEIRKGVAI